MFHHYYFKRLDQVCKVVNIFLNYYLLNIMCIIRTIVINNHIYHFYIPMKILTIILIIWLHIDVIEVTSMHNN